VRPIVRHAWPRPPSLRPRWARSLLSQFSQDVAMLSHHSPGGVHLSSKLRVVGCELNSFWSFKEVQAIPLSDMEIVQDFFRQNDSDGVANCCDFDGSTHLSFLFLIITEVIMREVSFQSRVWSGGRGPGVRRGGG